jgi:glycolate oxidase iron-sulfur subunit
VNKKRNNTLYFKFVQALIADRVSIVGMENALSPSLRSELAQQCVRCGLCLPHCPTYAIAQNEAESPRGRISLMAAIAETPDLIGSAPQQTLDNCLSCRRCESACPAQVPYESLLLATRAELTPNTSTKMHTILWLMAHKPWLNALLSFYRLSFTAIPKSWRFISKPPKRQAPISTSSKNALFTGCIADTFEQTVRIALIKMLQAVGESTEIPAQQVCCGQAARHAGNSVTTKKLASSNRTVFSTYERLLVLASGCSSALQESVSIPVIDACTYLDQRAEKLRFHSAQGITIAVHTPCSASFEKSQLAVFALLQRIPDLNVIALPDTGCCGAAGLHQFIQPQRAEQMRTPILNAVDSNSASIILSQNIGCRLHFANATAIPVQHPIEFMAQFIHDI